MTTPTARPSDSSRRADADVAEELGLSTETVKSCLRSAMRRLGCHSRMETVETARRSGLLP